MCMKCQKYWQYYYEIREQGYTTEQAVLMAHKRMDQG
jgi:hypothetical protein